MAALTQLLAGLLFAHVAWFFFFLCGSALLSIPAAQRILKDSSPAESLMLVVVTTAAGIAIVGLFAFFAALCSALYAPTLAVLILLLGTFCARIGDSPFKAPFWAVRFALWRRSATLGALLCYVIALVLSIRAYIPDIGSDATAYHTLYAFEWASAHSLVIDQWLRFPYYANNWLLIEAWAIEFGFIQFIPFLTWLCGLLSLLGAYSGIRAFAPRGVLKGFSLEITALLAVMGVALSPIFLKWADSGFIDVQIGFFFLSFALAGMAATQSRKPVWLWYVIVCAGFLAGLKVSLIALVPLTVAVIAFCGSALRFTGKQVCIAILVASALASPWYIRNLVAAGDPIAPTLNLAFHGVDSKWSRADMRDVMGDLRTDRSVTGLLELPGVMFLNPSSREVRDVGVTALVVTLFLPGILLVLALRRRGTYPDYMYLAAAMLVYALAYWNLTSHLARYALLFYAVLAMFTALSVLHAAGTRGWIPIAVMALCVVPSPAAASWYQTIWTNDYVHQWAWFTGYDAWLEPRAPGYPQVEYIARLFAGAHRTDLRVYQVQAQEKALYFRERGITSIGDWYGPERYVDFAYAVRTHAVADYIRRFNIGAFMIPTASSLIPTPRSLSYADLVTLDREMTDLGFTKREFTEGRFVVYSSPLVAPPRI